MSSHQVDTPSQGGQGGSQDHDLGQPTTIPTEQHHLHPQQSVAQLPSNSNDTYVCQWSGCGKRVETPEVLYVRHRSHNNWLLTI